MNHRPKVIVGMSGGVDSSVSALLLKQAGYDVTGLFMKNWEEEDENGACSAEKEYADVIRVAEQLDIPYYTVNFTKEYRERVFSHFLNELKAGRTPNPDILCNSEIKFEAFFNKAMELGADFLATGHYCRVGPNQTLMRGRDTSKDQSYFLHAIDGKTLSKVLFPIGDMEKSEVRKLALEAGLATATKKDSTGICFIGKRDFGTFLSSYIPYQKGDFKRLDGTIVGEHGGCAYYTIGQRQGICIGGPGDAWYVVGKDHTSNTVYVEQGKDHPALFASSLTCNTLSWISGPPTFPLRCTAKIRYRQEDVACTVTQCTDNQLLVTFDHPERAVTPGQSVVFYQGDLCLGGAIITSSSGILLTCQKKINQRN